MKQAARKNGITPAEIVAIQKLVIDLEAAQMIGKDSAADFIKHFARKEAPANIWAVLRGYLRRKKDDQPGPIIWRGSLKEFADFCLLYTIQAEGIDAGVNWVRFARIFRNAAGGLWDIVEISTEAAKTRAGGRTIAKSIEGVDMLASAAKAIKMQRYNSPHRQQKQNRKIK